MPNIKDRLFQYAYDDGIHSLSISISSVKVIEDTELITEEQANQMWQKYYPDVIKRIKNNQRPQMCIWKACATNTDYHQVEKEIDWRDDLVVETGKIYKTEKIVIA